MMEKEKQPTSLRILHSAALLSPSSGMLSQMQWEQEAANALGIAWRVKMYCPNNAIGSYDVMQHDPAIEAASLKKPWGKLMAWFKLRLNYHRWLLSQQDEVDVFLLRYYVHDPFQLWFVQRCKKPVYFVHHTLEVPELALAGGWMGWLRSNLEKVLGKWTIARATGIIGVTQEIADYEANRGNATDKPRHVYPNGIVFKEQDLIDRRRTDVPEFLFVANFAPWHGLDLLLAAVAESKEKFVLHLVGSIPDELVKLTSDSRVMVHGQLNQQQISHLSQQCWIGLGLFALDRKKMKQACPLKVREYLLLGLPVYGDYQEAFPGDFPFFRADKADIGLIMNYCARMRNWQKSDVCRLSRPSIDKEVLLQRLNDVVSLTSRSLI